MVLFAEAAKGLRLDDELMKYFDLNGLESNEVTVDNVVASIEYDGGGLTGRVAMLVTVPQPCIPTHDFFEHESIRATSGHGGEEDCTFFTYSLDDESWLPLGDQHGATRSFATACTVMGRPPLHDLVDDD